MSLKNTIVVTCGKGINQILAEEIREHGYQTVTITPYTVELRGTLEDCMYLNLHLRTATKVLLLIKRFRAAHPDQLYKAVSGIPWEDHLKETGYVCVTSHIQNRFILDTRFGNQKVKDAIVDRIYNQKGRRPDSGPKRDQAVLYLYWVDADCHLYFDTSGETISKHGYRRIPFKAPLREALAAAIIRGSQWKPDMPFINPMAGSGTLAIEAAMISRNIPPGLKRTNFGFMHLRSYNEEAWNSLIKTAKNKVQPAASATILVNDSSLEALRAARKNAEWADVASCIRFEHGDFSETPVPDPPGVVMLNPEYGSRLGEAEQLENTYAKIGDFLKSQCAGYWGYIFTGNPDLTKKIGLRSSKKIPLYNGKIECRLIEYELYQGSKKIGGQVQKSQ
jgi:putative N6-adenine-specific DNA methylase